MFLSDGPVMTPDLRREVRRGRLRAEAGWMCAVSVLTLNACLVAPEFHGVPVMDPSMGKHLHLDSAQTAHDPSRPEGEVAGLMAPSMEVPAGWLRD
jgi:hypothetical protein